MLTELQEIELLKTNHYFQCYDLETGNKVTEILGNCLEEVTENCPFNNCFLIDVPYELEGRRACNLDKSKFTREDIDGIRLRKTMWGNVSIKLKNYQVYLLELDFKIKKGF